jgi:hypothetical protein
MKHKWPIILLFAALPLFSLGQTKYTISGFIKEKGSEELLIGASIAVPSLKTGTITNNYGFYSLTLPEGEYELLVSYIGYKPKGFKIKLNANVENNIWLEAGTELSEVVISSKKQNSGLAEVTRMSVIEIPIQQIKDIPALLGEKDVLKVIQLLPGVQKGNEGNSGIYVRGGGPDQNLIILDDATVYNAFHLFGFFSLFNGDALKSVELTKGGFPARYGGRLSSVIDMSMKEGNKEEFHGEGGIGVISSRLTLEGPIVKGKSSFLVSGRRTYVDALISPFLDETDKTGYYFYDFNAKANYEIDTRNKIYVSGYVGRDKFYYNSNYFQDVTKSSISWGNLTGTFRWNHVFAPKLFGNFSFIASNYNFNVSSQESSDSYNYSYKNGSGIRDYAGKFDLDYRPSTNHTIKMGVHSINHLFTPSAITVKDDNFGSEKVTKFRAWENALYAEDDIKVGNKLRLNPGLRISHFNVQQKNFVRFEPRFSASYNLKSDLALKAAYSLMNQYVHLLSNTTTGLPTDLWVPTTRLVKPQQSWQIAGGVAKDFLDKGFSVSLEGYYKESSNIISYKEGASFLEVGFEDTPEENNSSWEDQITAGLGWSYGAELLVQKKSGKFTGWIGYTLSWTKMRFADLNFGKEFYARYDRRHDISLVGMYEFRKPTDLRNGLKLSATWVYGTGNAITLPVAKYDAPIDLPGQVYFPGFNTVSEYTDRNAFRMAPYHRFDMGLQIQKKKKLWIRTWEFSIYNLYNRYNPFFYDITYNLENVAQLTQISLFPIIPSLSWSIKF